MKVDIVCPLFQVGWNISSLNTYFFFCSPACFVFRLPLLSDLEASVTHWPTGATGSTIPAWYPIWGLPEVCIHCQLAGRKSRHWQAQPCLRPQGRSGACTTTASAAARRCNSSARHPPPVAEICRDTAPRQGLRRRAGRHRLGSTVPGSALHGLHEPSSRGWHAANSAQPRWCQEATGTPRDLRSTDR